MSNNQQIVMNRIKVTLVEKQKTNRWLAEQMGKSENTISIKSDSYVYAYLF